MELTVYNTSGKETGKKVQIADAIANAEPNDHAIYLAVKQYMANQRQGTHKAKERSEMSGSTRKLGKQKGGGGARRGDINSPLLHGGARVFGPRPRDYSFKLNKKVKALARLSALSYKFKEDGVKVVEDFSFEAPKTKQMVELLKNLNLSDKKSLLVLAESNKFVFLSSRNLRGIKVVNVKDLNTYDILNAKNLLFVESSASKLNEICAE
ncbi:MAG: 50S ribosomal protein L4 [Bacteroidales bacterium]|nr:50S ribosomal protein L4 [Bacteroidales bacterium]MDE5609060.1 50S ribosomal protein L4 [Bacteroidales bacterium]MDE5762862.1 50S ribosomal protein L4 [Bacteroidales bacterium]MDE6631322.1 50S ribosomal protein L4 [Bacteroidales bacterium]MDE7102254.1 50S ribosomal protein L4 [Bacteroidales bacterium]